MAKTAQRGPECEVLASGRISLDHLDHQSAGSECRRRRPERAQTGKEAGERVADPDDVPVPLRQILRYGAAYLFCRIHLDRLPVGKRPAMCAVHVALNVAAPVRYYTDNCLPDCLSRARESLRRIGGDPAMRGLSMSLDALAFPKWFDRLPFSNGAEVRNACDRSGLADTGRKIVDAFNGLRSVFPDQGETKG